MNKSDFRQVKFSEIKQALGEPENSSFIVARPDELNLTTTLFDEPIRLEGGAIVLCLEGQARVTVNLQTHTLQKWNMLLVSRNSVIHYHNHSADFKSYIVNLAPGIFEGAPLGSLIPSLVEIFENPLFELNEKEAQVIIREGKFISEKSLDLDHPYHKEIMQHLMLVLLYEVTYLFQRQRKTVHLRQRTHAEKVMEDFGQLLGQHYKTERNVDFYAGMLCLTPKYFSTLIKKTSGRSVPEWIRYALIMDSKIQLKYTTLTVQQISEMLNFPNPSFFGRFFKKHAGMTPLEYRMS